MRWGDLVRVAWVLVAGLAMPTLQSLLEAGPAP